MTNALATRKDIEDTLQVLNVIMTRIDQRFTNIETNNKLTQNQIQNVLNQLDAYET